MMKKWSVVFVGIFMAAAVLAPAAQAAIEVSGDAYLGFFDKYLWRGFDLSGGKPVVQGGVDLSTHGFTLSYWSNLLTKDARILGTPADSGDITETDITLDYTYDINELLSVGIGNIFYSLDGAADTNELYFNATVNTLLSPSVKIYWDYDEAREDGYFITGSVGHSFELMDKLGLNLGALISYNGASDYSVGDYHNWHNYELSASLDYAVTDQVSISPSFVYSDPISSEAEDTIEDEILAGLTATFTF